MGSPWSHATIKNSLWTSGWKCEQHPHGGSIHHHVRAEPFCSLFYSDRLKMNSSLTGRVCSGAWNEEIKEVKALKRCQIQSCAVFLKTRTNTVRIFTPHCVIPATLPFMLPDPETSLCSWPPFKRHLCRLCLPLLSQMLPSLWSPTSRLPFTSRTPYSSVLFRGRGSKWPRREVFYKYCHLLPVLIQSSLKLQVGSGEGFFFLLFF